MTIADDEQGTFELELDDILGFSSPEPEPDPEPDPSPEPEPVHDGEGDGETGPEPVESVEPEPVADAEPELEEDEDELTSTKRQNEALLARLNALEERVLARKPDTDTKVKEKPDQVSDEDKALAFLSDEDDLDEILAHKGKLNELMKKVYLKARDDAYGKLNGNFQQEVSPVIIDRIQKYLTLDKGVEAFFGANPELLPVRKAVGTITDEIVAEHGDWSLQQVLEEAGTRTRTLYGIKKKGGPGNDRTRNPALINKGSSRQSQADLRTAEQKEIDEIISMEGLL